MSRGDSDEWGPTTSAQTLLGWDPFWIADGIWWTEIPVNVSWEFKIFLGLRVYHNSNSLMGFETYIRGVEIARQNSGIPENFMADLNGQYVTGSNNSICAGGQRDTTMWNR
ncbi:hypothetical protein FB451DRAFT_1359666 [Mycena latifolia]|nr:hypothetical protein FB451DRAFT_1359666 [Mycena latifolia]